MIQACRSSEWHGHAWRHHAAAREATNSAGSIKFSGRYNRGHDQFDPAECWEALYLSLGRDIVLGELIKHLGEDGKPQFPRLRNRRISKLYLELANVVDCRDVSSFGLQKHDLSGDDGSGEEQAYLIGHAIAGAAVLLGHEAMLVPSATLLGDNVIVFPANPRHSSRIAVIESVDPVLYVKSRHSNG
ncbi:MAG TPA: RES family NAD+ phosphorylase [Thermomicrobiales bacterium]|mgnify:CR=1 FL=1|jgi:RES domain-containing protein|nr:hypothetical protein [Chloroflexota bacterium]HQX63074.1 RES family NAD+ phosphorylase [Thermomicrobiales bacterium]HQZ91106.1 RES family NAD+ phosphorylase [Thermomicrobiales bacterium]HRA32858.1 RES family NAD+ phosphorylase [Thermomicrobiales bacterium]